MGGPHQFCLSNYRRKADAVRSGQKLDVQARRIGWQNVFGAGTRRKVSGPERPLAAGFDTSIRVGKQASGQIRDRVI